MRQLVIPLLIATCLAASAAHAIFGKDAKDIRDRDGRLVAGPLTPAEKAVASSTFPISQVPAPADKVHCSSTLVNLASADNALAARIPAAIRMSCNWAVLTAAHCLLDDANVFAKAGRTTLTPTKPVSMMIKKPLSIWLPGPGGRKEFIIGNQVVLPRQELDPMGIVPGKNDWAVVVPTPGICAQLPKSTTPLEMCKESPDVLAKKPSYIAGYSHYLPMNAKESEDCRNNPFVRCSRCVAPYRDTKASCVTGVLHMTQIPGREWSVQPGHNDENPTFPSGHFKTRDSSPGGGYERGDSGGLVLFENKPEQFCAGGVMSGVDMSTRTAEAGPDALSGLAVLGFPILSPTTNAPVAPKSKPVPERERRVIIKSAPGAE